MSAAKKSSAAADDASGDSYEDDDEAGDSDVPAEFESAYDEWKADPSADTMWRMIKACVGGDY